MMRWLAISFAAATLLSLVLLNLHWLQSPVDVSPVAAKTPSAREREASARNSSMPNGDASTAVSESLARPLFHRTRRPFQAAPEIIEEAIPVDVPEVVAEQPTPVARPPLRLVGLSASNGRHRALLSIGEDGSEPRWYGVGDSVEGWTIDAITSKDVRLGNGNEGFTVALYPSSIDRTSLAGGEMP